MRELELFHFWRSSASWRVRWALELKRVPYKLIPVDLLAGEEKQESYRQKNPAAYLPCLITPQGPLGESLAIIDWLEAEYPRPVLYPADPFLRARLMQITETVNSGIQPMQNPDVTKKISSDQAEQTAWIQYWAGRGMDVVESLVTAIRNENPAADHKFIFGATPSVADLCLIPQCYASNRFGVDLALFPQCKAVYEHALLTPECAASHPEKVKS